MLHRNPQNLGSAGSSRVPYKYRGLVAGNQSCLLKVLGYLLPETPHLMGVMTLKILLERALHQDLFLLQDAKRPDKF